jgi:hypothetical protein
MRQLLRALRTQLITQVCNRATYSGNRRSLLRTNSFSNGVGLIAANCFRSFRFMSRRRKRSPARAGLFFNEWREEKVGPRFSTSADRLPFSLQAFARSCSNRDLRASIRFEASEGCGIADLLA